MSVLEQPAKYYDMHGFLLCATFVSASFLPRQQLLYNVGTMSYLNHRPVSDEIRPEVRNVFGKISDVANQCSLEADLSLAQLVGSALGLCIHGE